MVIFGPTLLILILAIHIISLSLVKVPTHLITARVGIASRCDVFLFYFTRSGILYLRGNTLNELGMNNFVWLSTTSTSKDIAFMSYYSKTLFYPGNAFGRVDGFSLRCLSSLPRPSGRGRRRLIVCHRSGF